MVCAYRARASRWPRPLFVDPWAEKLAGPDGHAIAKHIDLQFPPMEVWLALRVAYLDRLVGLAVDRLGARQIAILDARYRVIEPVAQGAMGTVYRAERIKLGQIGRAHV